ncbi:MAG TPA: winged helix-turn-helix domain-containing protein, partial [Candidatus Lokiarchaeia archaeon]
MGKKKRKNDFRKDIFDKVNAVFKNPIRTDIIQELSSGAQRPIDLAGNIGVQKQVINYHLNELKKEGLVKSQRIQVPLSGKIEGEIDNLRGVRVNGVDKNGNLEITYGVELTKNGKDIAENFVNRLYEESVFKDETKIENNKKKNKE